jgi:hypothetical protein
VGPSAVGGASGGSRLLPASSVGAAGASLYLGAFPVQTLDRRHAWWTAFISSSDCSQLLF